MHQDETIPFSETYKKKKKIVKVQVIRKVKNCSFLVLNSDIIVDIYLILLT